MKTLKRIASAFFKMPHAAAVRPNDSEDAQERVRIQAEQDELHGRLLDLEMRVLKRERRASRNGT